MDNDKKRARKPAKRRLGLKILLVLLLVILVLLGAGAIKIGGYLQKIRRVEETPTTVIPPEEATDEVDPLPPAASGTEPEDDGLPHIEVIEWWKTEKLDDDELVNILLVGQDSRGDTRERSDAMLLCSINTETYEVSMISFLRDLYVQMPEGYMDNRMNAAYAFGGFPFLYEVFEKNFGLTIDGGVEVNFEGFKSIIELLGGVDVELTAAEADYLDCGLHEGMNHLTAEQALSYSRIRYLDSDFGRTQRQRNVMNSIFASLRNADAKTLFAFIDEFLPFVTTDMTNRQILSLAVELVPHMKSVKLNSYRIPTDDGYYNDIIREMMVLVPDLETNCRAIREYLPISDSGDGSR